MSAAEASVLRVDRRRFLAVTGVAAGALTLGAVRALTGPLSDAATAIMPMLSIRYDGRIFIAIPVAEMGQGVATSLPLVIAEELDADWSQVEILRFDTSMPKPAKGQFITANSSSVSGWFDPLRQCGAVARAMLVAAAERHWKLKPGSCSTSAGKVVHPDGRTMLSYGQLAEAAARETVPAAGRFKQVSEYRLIGRDRKRTDVPDKCTGRARFAVDVRLPGMLFASVRQGPVAGATLARYDTAAARAVPGVRDLFPIGEGKALAVVASNSWSAFQALDAADPQFELKPGATLDSDGYQAALKPALDRPGVRVGAEDAAASLGAGAISATYEVPFLAHATMEPMSCVARFDGQRCELWAGTQIPFILQSAVAKAHGLVPDDVVVHQTLLGGGFGRRAEADFALQAVEIAKRTGAPVCLIWSRPEDMRHDVYRPAYAIRCEATTGSGGTIKGWRSKIAGASLMRHRSGLKDPRRADPTVIESLLPELYGIADSAGEWVEVDTTVPVGFWRSVAHSQNLFAVESFIDELAHRAGRDPYEYRRAQLRDPRAIAVLDKAAELGRWREALPTGHGRGIALARCYGSYIAAVIEASVKDGAIRLHRIANVIDCGIAIHPDNVIAQVEGGCLFGLSAAVHGEIKVQGGAVEQSSFGDYPVLTLSDVPPMTTHIMRSSERPGGVGETATPTAAPALANALFVATGRRVRRLPLARAFA